MATTTMTSTIRNSIDSPKSAVLTRSTSATTKQTSELTLDEALSMPPPHAVDALPKAWNASPSLTSKTISTFVGLLVAGMNDAAYGAIIPSLQDYYHVTYTVVSLIFLSPLVGYLSAAMLNNLIHAKLGQRGVAFIGPSCHLGAYIIIACHPPFPVLVVAFILAGLGNGVLEAGWNAFAGNLANPNEILGVLHGFFGLGATIAPLIASAMIAKNGLPWFYFYYIMAGAATIELLSAVASFWKENGARFREAHRGEDQTGATRAALKERVTWVSAIFLMVYVGIEVALGGWVVTFMINVRNGTEFDSGISATGFWLGLTVGRVVLGFVTPKIGENASIILYMGLAVVMQILFWLVPSFVASAVTVALVGFFIGPLFPAVVVATTKLLPKHLHVGAIGFAAAFGGTGACVFPFAVGAIAQRAGVRVLQPIIIGMLVCALLIWAIAMPRIGDKENDEMRWISRQMKKTMEVIRSHTSLTIRLKNR